MSPASAHDRGGLAPFLLGALLLHAAVAWWTADTTVRRSAVPDARPAVTVRLLSAPKPAPAAAAPAPPPPAPPVVERRAKPEPAPEPLPAEPTPPMPPVESVIEAPATPAPPVEPVLAPPSAPEAELALAPAPATGPATPTEDELERYKALVLSRIDAHKRYPMLARRRGIEGTVTIHIAIAETGELSLYEETGEAPRLLGKPTRQAVEDAGPFPPPPGGALELRIPVDYRLD